MAWFGWTKAGGILAMVLGGTAVASSTPADTAVAAALKDRLPRTEVAKIDCATVEGLCEVTAGKSLFYVDKSARYLIVGHLYDMETRQDLTSARLLEINPEALLGGASRRPKADGDQADDDGDGAALASAEAGAPVARDYPVRRTAVAPAAVAGAGAEQSVSLAGLPASGAIQWGRGAQRVTIFTDFRCSYCRALVGTLETMNVTVIERPISVLGSRALSDRVYCAKDRVRALRLAYAGETPPAASCDTSGLDANERFARAHGFTGTPVIVRSDGAVLHGFRSKEVLAQWLKGAGS
jgi:thiol:disulfide interchange protein DsbC